MQAQQPEAGPSDSHRMRITTGGSISGYVNFAKGFLVEHPNRPLILHTLPSITQSSALGQTQGQKGKQRETQQSGTGRSGLHSCTTAIPRLISVVEQIKRELINSQRAFNGTRSIRPQGEDIDQEGEGPKGSKAKTKGKNAGGSSGNMAGEQKRIRGIWQYTESGLLDLPTQKNIQGEEEDPLLRVLSGKTKPKMIHRPYMQITLSTRPLGLENGRNVTCQYVMVKKRQNVFSNGDQNESEDEEGADGAEDAEGRASAPAAGDMSIEGSEVLSKGVKGQKRRSSVNEHKGKSKRAKQEMKVLDLGVSVAGDV